MTDFFYMGGYAFFVWSSYLIVSVLFSYFYFSPVIKHRAIRKQLALLQGKTEQQVKK